MRKGSFFTCVLSVVWNLMVVFMGHGSRMLERLSKDASQLHEDMILQLHQMQDTVRYTFFECFLALSGKFYPFQKDLNYVATSEVSRLFLCHGFANGIPISPLRS